MADPTGPIMLGPGTIVAIAGVARRSVLGLVLAGPPEQARPPLHLVCWNDGRVTRSNFGLGPVRRAHEGPGWSTSLIVVRDG